MDHEATAERSEERRVIDPYGGVALGVECAWPQSIPFDHDHPADTRETHPHP
jgi:hypothetical protein